jgi:hypothetical protein
VIPQHEVVELTVEDTESSLDEWLDENFQDTE